MIVDAVFIRTVVVVDVPLVADGLAVFSPVEEWKVKRENKVINHRYGRVLMYLDKGDIDEVKTSWKIKIKSAG